MTKGLIIAAFFGIGIAGLAQETPTVAPTPSPSPVRAVRISFLPPPLEGTISLGIYDANGQLVRVLHQEAELDEFTVGADALVTNWDGKNDDGEDLPSGKYHARGFLVGHLKIEDLGKGASPVPDSNATGTAPVKLMPNPLAKDAKTMIDPAVGFDDVNSYLKTTDGLPLFTISPTPNLVRASITKSGEKSIDVFEDDGTTVEQYRISNIDKMMAFDCGDFELK
ncbi:MAG TPA: hypothetical protein VJ252_08715 [Chthoniobacterales bacterium]|nr:hypothetical protein [Chthoniobacterales bacterium]